MATATELPPPAAAPAAAAPPLPTPHAERDALAGLMLTLQPGHQFAFTGADWGLYTFLLDTREKHHRNAVSITYHRGRLEVMTKSGFHERYAYLLGRFVTFLAEELSVPLIGCRETTVRRDDLKSGFEPDEWFYLGPTATRMVGVATRRKLDFAADPPPDLAIEVEISRTLDDRLPLYAALGVSELWRYDGERLVVQRIAANRVYEAVPASAFFPTVPVAELVRFVRLADAADDSAVAREFRAWVRQLPPPAAG